jgi:hypothetical protein
MVAVPFSMAWALMRPGHQAERTAPSAEDRVDLADGLRHAIVRAHREDLLHGLDTGEG